MAVLKYRASDGTVKTLGLNQSGGIAGVTSVNGKTGAVTGLYDAENPPPYPVTSVNGKTGAVTGLYDAENPPPYPVTSVNGKTGAVTGLYDAENPPPYPVTHVLGSTGSVNAFNSFVLTFNASETDGNPFIWAIRKDGYVKLHFTEDHMSVEYSGSPGIYNMVYDENNPPPYPVTSVNGQTGAVTIPTPKINGTITSGSLIGTGLQMWKIALAGVSADVISTDKNYTINGDYTKIYPIAMIKAQFGRGFAGTLSINPYTPSLEASFHKDSDSFDFNGDYYIWLYNEDATATWG